MSYLSPTKAGPSVQVPIPQTPVRQESTESVRSNDQVLGETVPETLKRMSAQLNYREKLGRFQWNKCAYYKNTNDLKE